MTTSASENPCYFARTLHGLEQLSWRDIAGRTSSKIGKFLHRTIEFTSSSSPADLVQLRSVEDLFVKVAEISGITHERAMLQKISESLARFSFSAAFDLCSSVREIPDPPSFAITASFVGSRNFNRWELARSVQEAVERRHRKWQYVETRDTSGVQHDIHIRFLLEGDHALIGVRLADAPLHRRPYKEEHLAASLSPVVAYHMIRLAQLRPGEILLDPLCGVGTIPIEANLAEPDCIAMGIDISADAIAAARKNCLNAQASVAFRQGDIFETAFEPESVDVIASDLPWGKQSELQGGDYRELVKCFAAMLKQGGRLCVIGEETSEFEEALTAAGFSIGDRISLSLHGKHPSLLSARRD